MNRLILYIFSTITILLVSACADSTDVDYQKLSWQDLRPIDEQEADQSETWGSLEIVDDWGPDGYEQGSGLGGISSRAPAQSYSTGVVAEINGKSIGLPGFVVPIEFDEGNSITGFFLVPSFGACYHNPPPPPNQTVYVTSSEPIKYESIYDPVWIKGVIKTEQTGNDVATAAYSMDLHQIEPFGE